MNNDNLQDDNSGDDPDLPDRDGRDPGCKADDEEDLHHDSRSEKMDAFRQWVKTLPAKHWAKHDLSACALGWNAAVERFNKRPSSPTA